MNNNSLQDANKQTIQKYGKYRSLQQYIGQGGQASILIAEDPIGEQYAIKKYFHQASEKEDGEYNIAEEEYYLTKQCNNPYIIKSFGLYYQQNTRACGLVMEIAQKDLCNFLEEQGTNPLSEKEIINMISELTMGLKHLHEQDIIHRDLNLNNILMDSDNRLKITDFGIARQTKNVHYPKTSDKMTHQFAAPEQKQTGVTKQSDLFSLGNVLFAIAYTFQGWQELRDDHKSDDNTVYWFVNNEIDFDKIVNSFFQSNKQINQNNNIYKIVRGLLQFDPSKRMSLQQIQELIEEPIGYNRIYKLENSIDSLYINSQRIPFSYLSKYYLNEVDEIALRQDNLISIVNLDDQFLEDIANLLFKSNRLVKLEIKLRGTLQKIQNISKNGILTFVEQLKKVEKLNAFSLDLSNNNLDKNQFIFLSQLMKSLGEKIIHWSLNFQNTSLGNESYFKWTSMSYLAEMLSFNPKVQSLSLDLSQNEIGLQGIEEISKNLQKMSNLRLLKIDLSSNKICNNGIKSLSNAINNCNKIAKLELKFQQCQIGKITSFDLIIQEICNLQNLDSLSMDLSKNQVNDNFVESINTYFKKLRFLQVLNLNLSQNKLTNKGKFALFQGLKYCICLESLDLNLFLNEQSGKGANEIGELFTQLKYLKSLKLNFGTNFVKTNSMLDTEELGFIFNSVKKLKNLRNLYLNLRSNNINAIGASFLGNCLNNLPLISELSLNLYDNNVGELGSSVILEGITKLSKLRVLNLDLTFNKIGKEGCISLSNALSKVSQLHSLSLAVRSKTINSEDASLIIETISNLQHLQELKLNIFNNRVSVKEMKLLADKLKKFKNLIELDLDLSHLNIGNEGANLLWDSISNLKNLKKLRLDLFSNQISDEGLTKFDSALGSLSYLTEIFLHLGKNLLDWRGAKNIRLGLEELRKVVRNITLGVGLNKIGDKGCTEIAYAVGRLQKLNYFYLDVQQNQLSYQGTYSIVKNLNKLQNITHGQVVSKQGGDQDINIVEEYFEINV